MRSKQRGQFAKVRLGARTASLQVGRFRLRRRMIRHCQPDLDCESASVAEFRPKTGGCQYAFTLPIMQKRPSGAATANWRLPPSLTSKVIPKRQEETRNNQAGFVTASLLPPREC